MHLGSGSRPSGHVRATRNLGAHYFPGCGAAALGEAFIKPKKSLRGPRRRKAATTICANSSTSSTVDASTGDGALDGLVTRVVARQLEQRAVNAAKRSFLAQFGQQDGPIEHIMFHTAVTRSTGTDAKASCTEDMNTLIVDQVVEDGFFNSSVPSSTGPPLSSSPPSMQSCPRPLIGGRPTNSWFHKCPVQEPVATPPVQPMLDDIYTQPLVPCHATMAWVLRPPIGQ